MAKKEPDPIEDHEILDTLRDYVKKQRGYADHFDWPDKDLKEREVVADAFSDSRFEIQNLRIRELDPPDCEAEIDGEIVGIEVTELVDQAAIETAKRMGSPPFVAWDVEKFRKAVTERVAAKDQPHKQKGGPYSRYFLIIHTDEPDLSREKISTFVRPMHFETRLITDIVLVLSYDPSDQAYPTFPISAERK